MLALNIDTGAPLVPRDHRVTFGAHAARLRADYIILTNLLAISQIFKTPPDPTSKSPGGTSSKISQQYLAHCTKFIQNCIAENLPKFAVESTLQFSEFARSFQSYHLTLRLKANDAFIAVNKARELLEDATQLCMQHFQNSEALGKAVEETLRLLRKPWYEKVTPEELATIKVCVKLARSLFWQVQTDNYLPRQP
jgi:hypothetical protein